MVAVVAVVTVMVTVVTVMVTVLLLVTVVVATVTLVIVLDLHCLWQLLHSHANAPQASFQPAAQLGDVSPAI